MLSCNSGGLRAAAGLVFRWQKLCLQVQLPGSGALGPCGCGQEFPAGIPGSVLV